MSPLAQLLAWIRAIRASLSGQTIPPPDTQPPTITLSGPTQLITAAGPVLLTAAVGDNVGVKQVTFYRGQDPLGSRSFAPWTWPAPILPTDDGNLLFRAVVEDAAGNRTESTFTVAVDIAVPDLTAPTVSLVASSERFEADGTLTLTCAASDNVGVTQLRLERGSTLVQTLPVTGGTVTETITASSNGDHVYTLTAVDAAGNTSVATVRVVVVIGVADTTLPVISSLVITPSSLIQAGTVHLEADATDDVAVAYVDFFREKNGVRTKIKREGAVPYECTYGLTAADNGPVTFWAVVTDTSGNVAELAAQAQVNIPVPDTIKPTVSLTATPTPITSAGPVSLAATASDNVAVATLEFFRDSTLLATLNAPPFTFQDPITSSVANGTYTYRARATDAAGNWAEATKQVVINLPVVQATLTPTADALKLDWPPVQNASEYVVQRSYGASGREFVPVNMNRLTVNTFTDDTVYDGRMVWYRIFALVGGVEQFVAALNGTQAARVWTDAATLSSGTYTGLNIRNLGGIAISLAYKAEVTLLSCRMAATGHAVSGFRNLTTMRDCRSWSLMPAGAGKLHGNAVNAGEMFHLDMQHCFQEGFLTTQATAYMGDHTAANTFIAKYNVVRNVQGRRTNGSGGYQDYLSADGNDSSFVTAQAYLLDKLAGLVGAEIAWNSIYNEPGFSRVEDNINTFKTSGTAASPFRIHHNHIHGAYPALPTDPRSTYYTGGGIIAGDVGSGYVQIDDNLIGACSNYGLGLVGGNDNTGRRNKIIRAARTWDGARLVPTNLNGIQYYDYNGAGASVFRNNAVTDNVVGVEYENATGKTSTKTSFAVAQNIAGANNTYGGTTLIAGPVTYAMEYALWREHRDLAFAAGVTIGPRAPA